jgi:hypothetical protein
MQSLPLTHSPHGARRWNGSSSLGSLPGVLGAIVVLLAVPLAVLGEGLFAIGSQITVHLLLAMGVVLVSFSAFHFGIPRWLAWAGYLVASALGAIFLLQGLAELTQSAPLAWLAFQVLGQSLERALPDLLIVWFAGVLLLDSRGKTRLFGWLALSIAASFEIGRSIPGLTIDADIPGLRALFLLPFVWFAFEAAKNHPHKLR